MILDFHRGGFRSPSAFDPLPTQRVPLCTIFRYPFLADGPITSFDGEARAENATFW